MTSEPYIKVEMDEAGNRIETGYDSDGKITFGAKFDSTGHQLSYTDYTYKDGKLLYKKETTEKDTFVTVYSEESETVYKNGWEYSTKKKDPPLNEKLKEKHVGEQSPKTTFFRKMLEKFAGNQGK